MIFLLVEFILDPWLVSPRWWKFRLLVKLFQHISIGIGLGLLVWLRDGGFVVANGGNEVAKGSCDE